MTRLPRGRAPGSRRRALGRLVIPVAIAIAAVTGTGPALADPGSPGQPTTPVSTGDIAAARAQATALTHRLTQLDRQLELTHMRLVSVQDELGSAVGNHLSALQYGDALAQQQQQQRSQASQRVRDFYMAGGDLGLYLSVLDGQNPVDAYLQVQAVDTAVSAGYADSARTGTHLTAVRQRSNRLGAHATKSAQATARVQALVARIQQLRQTQSAALASANAQVRTLVKRYATQQAAAAQASSVTSLADLHLSGRADYVTPYARGAVDAALSKLGDPYVWGAEGPDSFDCSGLVQWAYGQAGLYVPRVVPDQYAASKPIPFADLHPGDVIVYGTTPANLYHITMYIGDGMMVEAPHTGDVVKVVPVSLTDAYGAARPGG
jgi:cell wall-associated NlpC family hydrolase